MKGERVVIGGTGYTFQMGMEREGPQVDRLSGATQETFGVQYSRLMPAYTPHVLLDGEEVAANVSATRIPFLLEGKRLECVQLGTVLTRPGYRGKGLSRYLIERVVGEWGDACDCLYLFAHDGVVDFYPRFGFATRREYMSVMPSPPRNTSAAVRRLDPDREEDRELLSRCYRWSNPFSRLTMVDSWDVLLFNWKSFFRDKIFHIPEYGAAVAVERRGEVLECTDIFCPPGPSLEEIVACLVEEGITRVEFGFATNREDLELEESRQPDTHLFFLRGREIPTEEKKLRFSPLSHM